MSLPSLPSLLQDILLLASVPLAHGLIVGRPLAISGRLSRLIDAARAARRPPEPALSEAELLAALTAATLAEFGDDALSPTPAPSPEPSPLVASTGPRPPLIEATFLLGLSLGGALAALLRGGPTLHRWLDGAGFARRFGSGPAALAALLVGGLLVGFGARMAGGCSSGHGLSGLSRLQPGSLVSTLSFFAAAVATAFVLEVLL